MARQARAFSARLFPLLLALMPAAAPAAAQPLPTVVVLATGGTIAGAGAADTQAAYQSAKLGVDQLIAAVPQAAKLATLRGEQVASVGSQDMTDAIWLALASRVEAALAAPEVAGVVITHGTDTLEETAYFLNLVVGSRKPVVLTAAMRPATALSADGPLNFYNAVAVAASPAAAGRGVLVVINDAIHGAAGVTKASTTAVHTFVSPTRGLLGTVTFGAIEFFGDPRARDAAQPPFPLAGVTALPRVDIVYAHAGMGPELIDAAVAAGARGLVVAGVGNGNMSASALQALARAAGRGVVCVRSSRVQHGAVGRNVEVDDDAQGLVASDELNPQKARVLLKLALLKPVPPSELQQMFFRY
jgi:L-asparaginase